MSEHQVTVNWKRGAPDFSYERYIGGAELLSITHCREHVAEFPQGLAEPDGAS
jgi:hypothetical protein